MSIESPDLIAPQVAQGPFPRDRDGMPNPPPLSELDLHPETLEVAGEICAVFAGVVLPSSTLELLVRAIAWSATAQIGGSFDPDCQGAERRSQF